MSDSGRVFRRVIANKRKERTKSGNGHMGATGQVSASFWPYSVFSKTLVPSMNIHDIMLY